MLCQDCTIGTNMTHYLVFHLSLPIWIHLREQILASYYFFFFHSIVPQPLHLQIRDIFLQF